MAENHITPEVDIDEAIGLLKRGYTRYETDAFVSGKSIQQYYNLNIPQCKVLFAQEEIKNLRVQEPLLIIKRGTERVMFTAAGAFPLTNTDNISIENVATDNSILESDIENIITTAVAVEPEIEEPIAELTEESIFDNQ